MDDAISVALRVRPLSASELSRGCQSCIDCIPNEPQVVMRNADKAFTFNYVFSPESSQAEVYDNAVKNLVPKLFKGYNVTILAYGQTGSGKTHSMGTCYNGEGEMGIIPRAVSDIFEKIAHSHDQDFKVSASFMELYKEQLFDLMACSTKPRDQCIVDIREDARGIHIPGLVDLEVKSVEETFKSLMMGSAGRATGATAMNAQSSRSHAIFTLTIQMCKKNNGGGDMVSKFHLVDLAGSERSKKTGATGERFKEGVNINKGLLALGNVISALGDGQQRGYVSYRDSKLTRLLQDSLGGNSITLMVACVSPADYNFEETLSTLRYADRARHIKNKPIINQDPKAAEILRLQKENNELRLQILGSGGKIGTCPKEHEDLADENDTLKAKNRKLTEALNNALSETTNLMERALLAELARDRMNMKLKELNAQCNMTIDQFDQSKENSPSTRGNLAGLKTIQSKIVELQAEQQHGEDEIKKHELSELSACKGGSQATDSTAVSGSMTSNFTPQSIAEFDQQEETHTLQQAELNKELQELTRALAIKEQLAATLLANSSDISTLNPENQENMKQLENQIDALQKERDALQQQLKSAQSNNASGKIAEQRRKRLQELEAQMSLLKKKLLEQSKIIKMKEKSDEKVVVLNNEIKSMKAMKVRLIRQMKSESEQFRDWKLQREKELNKLRDQDRKRQNIMTRMENMHSKQQNVLKRKVEEAAAINKRLKDALLLQKQCQEKRLHVNGKPERIQGWVSQELEVSASTVAAERVREKLVEDRAIISKQLTSLEENLKTALPSEVESMKQEISRLKEDLGLRSAQIADINQKILDSDQENKSKTRWDSLQSMGDAKHALKHLFDLAVDIKKDGAMKEYTIEDLEENCKKLNAEVKIVEEKLKAAEQNHRSVVLELEKENVEKIAVLLKKLRKAEENASVPVEGESELKKKYDLLREENEKLCSIIDDIERLKESSVSNEKDGDLESDKENSEADNFKSPNVLKKRRIKKPLNQTWVEDLEAIDSSFASDVEIDDSYKDPDYRQTPLFKRLQKAKLHSKTSILDESVPKKLNFATNKKSVFDNSAIRKISGSDGDLEQKLPVKRTSDGSSTCKCTGTCGGRCGCRKLGSSCSNSCRCSKDLCTNQSKEKSPESDESESEISHKRPRNETFTADNSSPQLVKPSGSGERKYFPEAKF
ncbi:chromosome-associated kinesin KIF4 [Thrips palmi]|uniref:Chromosome-associated kinesin KIF4 n=1 Tax=Thrips palmi TaxID=161013 RepID=A0A6P8Y8R5_THRPL|nr:chromosome-associated kinesin KIF4 [Thrips palmi]